MKYFYDLFPVMVYTEEVPQNFVVPSIFVPIPSIFNGNDTNMTFNKTFSLSVKLFHESSSKAFSEAERITNAVSSGRDLIPIVDVTGNKTSQFIRVNRIEARESDGGVAIIVVNWNSNYFYDRETWPALQDIQMHSEVSENEQ